MFIISMKESYYQRHREQVLEKQKKYYREHRKERLERQRDYNKIWILNNKDKIREYNKKYYSNNREKYLNRYRDRLARIEELEKENKKLKETIKDHQLYEEKLEHRIIELEELLHWE